MSEIVLTGISLLKGSMFKGIKFIVDLEGDEKAIASECIFIGCTFEGDALTAFGCSFDSCSSIGLSRDANYNIVTNEQSSGVVDLTHFGSGQPLVEIPGDGG